METFSKINKKLNELNSINIKKTKKFKHKNKALFLVGASLIGTVLLTSKRYDESIHAKECNSEFQNYFNQSITKETIDKYDTFKYYKNWYMEDDFILRRTVLEFNFDKYDLEELRNLETTKDLMYLLPEPRVITETMDNYILNQINTEYTSLVIDGEEHYLENVGVSKLIDRRIESFTFQKNFYRGLSGIFLIFLFIDKSLSSKSYKNLQDLRKLKNDLIYYLEKILVLIVSSPFETDDDVINLACELEKIGCDFSHIQDITALRDSVSLYIEFIEGQVRKNLEILMNFNYEGENEKLRDIPVRIKEYHK
ncbi:MAG: hypothetical protein R3Y13_01875 [bacterium]